MQDLILAVGLYFGCFAVAIPVMVMLGAFFEFLEKGNLDDD